MLVEKFDFELPENLIAKFPVEPRDHAKLLLYDKHNDEIVEDRFYNLSDYLNEGDVLVFNDTKVIPARLKITAPFKGEILFIEPVDGLWKVMVRPGRKFKLGVKMSISELDVEVKRIDEDGLRYLSINFTDEELIEYLRSNGKMPVPPYISGDMFCDEDYNTVYSKREESIAAPTAGLHFTEELLDKIRASGVITEFVSLSVGLGTFLPVKVEDSELHKMHSEKYEIVEEVALRLNQYVKDKRRIIAVGTTSIRVLEDNFNRFGKINAGKYDTDIFIKPGYKWAIVGGMITNFHLPKSTLIMLVSAFIGLEMTMKIYNYAIQKKYRFYSFGDGMFLR